MPTEESGKLEITLQVPATDNKEEFLNAGMRELRDAWTTTHPRKKRGAKSKQETVFGACDRIYREFKSKMPLSQGQWIQRIREELAKRGQPLDDKTITKHFTKWMDAQLTLPEVPRKRRDVKEVAEGLRSFMQALLEFAKRAPELQNGISQFANTLDHATEKLIKHLRNEPQATQFKYSSRSRIT